MGSAFVMEYLRAGDIAQYSICIFQRLQDRALKRNIAYWLARMVIPVSENLVQVVNSPMCKEFTFATQALIGQSKTWR